MVGRFLQDYWLILLPCLLGAAAIYLLLPRAGRSWPILGVLFGVAALVVAGLHLVKTETIWVESFLFYAFSGLAILGGALMVSQANPVHAALSFALVVLSSSGLFLLQAAPFLMAATVIVYAGAIIVTFLFVIMLAQQAGFSNADRRSREPFLATLAGFIVLAAMLCILHKTYDTAPLDRVLEQTRRAADADSVKNLQSALGDVPAFIEHFSTLVDVENIARDDKKSASPTPREELAIAVRNAEQPLWKLAKAPAMFDAADLNDVKKQLHAIVELGSRVRERQGQLDPGVPISPFTSVGNLETGPGKERLPASNVNFLGRALFTQYLLAVELAGVLLLVASIGAIAIAARRAEGLR